MVPTFSSSFEVTSPKGKRPKQNGWNYDEYEGPKSGIGRVYTPSSTEIDEDAMGAIPATIVAMPQRVRGNHPLVSFAAVGPQADKLIAGQTSLDVFVPLKALAEANGSVLLIGVELGSMTLLHLAEERAGRNMFIRWVNGPDGQAMATKQGGCSKGFINFNPILSLLERKAQIGRSVWFIYPVKEVLEVATKAIQENPELTHCSDPRCIRCNDAVMGGPLLT